VGARASSAAFNESALYDGPRDLVSDREDEARSKEAE
jgi:hypothetical protein